MMPAGRRLLALAVALAASGGAASVLAPAAPAQAEGLFSQPKYAAVVVDANSGEVLYAKRADALRYPASITKIMTLYLTFEALSTGRLNLEDRITISPHAAGMAPSKISTRPGESLSVRQAIEAVTVHSANDVAVALAERVGGSESRFAELMTLRAQELGMANTRFVNASGLPDSRQITTARDIATLSRAIMRDYPQYYSYFGEKSFAFGGKLMTNHNHLLLKMPGVDGIKTGYTAAAGFNLAASAVRDGRRLITVVLGGPSTAARDENVAELLNAGFNVLERRAHGDRITLASAISEPDDSMAGPLERAPVEMGSGDQADLQIDVKPEVRTLPTLAAARALAAKPAESNAAIAKADASPCRPSRKHGRGRHAQIEACATVAKAERARETADHGKDALNCTTGRGRHRRHVACADGTAIASAGRGRKDREQTQVASSGGAYMIQVGAYKNRAQAKDHLQQVSGGFGHLVAAASPKLERAGGSYRVRFRGLSEKSAQAACHALSAHGQPCMVMAAS
jgi:D-alanyl-D-alanine carboxypeptidase